MSPEDRKIEKKKEDVLDAYIEKVGKEKALRELRQAMSGDDNFESISPKNNRVGGGEFADPLPLRNDPFRYQIRAMQNFTKPVD